MGRRTPCGVGVLLPGAAQARTSSATEPWGLAANAASLPPVLKTGPTPVLKTGSTPVLKTGPTSIDIAGGGEEDGEGNENGDDGDGAAATEHSEPFGAGLRVTNVRPRWTGGELPGAERAEPEA